MQYMDIQAKLRLPASFSLIQETFIHGNSEKISAIIGCKATAEEGQMGEGSKYLEQFERVKRWYQRFEEIDRGIKFDRDPDFYQDEVMAFFLNCYHLKDWIKNDSHISPSVRSKVEDYINNTYPLKLCADIANGIKHLKLESPPRTGQQPEFGGKKYNLTLGSMGQVIQIKYSIDTQAGPVDAFTLASDCVSSWENFLKNHQLT